MSPPLAGASPAPILERGGAGRGLIVGLDASNLRQGGGITHLTQLLAAAEPDRAGVSSVIVWAGASTLQQLSNRSWLRLVHEPLLDRRLPARLYWQWAVIGRRARSAGCDVIFAPGGNHLASFRPFVTMSRNLLPFAREERQRYGYTHRRLRLDLLRHAQSASLRRADGVIFLTDTARRTVMECTGPLDGQIRTIPHGIGGRFHQPPRPQHPIGVYTTARPFRLLYVSSMDVYKHQDEVMTAVAMLRERGFPVRMDFVGAGAHATRRALEQRARALDPAGEVIFIGGPRPHAELPAVYHEADAFVFASSCENMPNILLEAMAAGLPVASSDRGVMPEVLGDAGVYFDPVDPVDIARAVATLLDDMALRTTIAQRAVQRASAYSWERCAHETFSFIAEVAARSTLRRAGSF